MKRNKRTFATMSAVLILVLGRPYLAEATKKGLLPEASFYLSPHPVPGSMLSDITYRVISIYGPGIEDQVTQTPATATLTFLPSDSPETIRMTVDARADGMAAFKGIGGEYRNRVTQTCYNGQCKANMDASSPFYNPTFWGSPQDALTAGQTWAVTLTAPWELGPPATQTITVLSVDERNGIVVLKRQGEGVGPYAGASNSVAIKKDGKSYTVAVKRGKAHWVGQAVFQHAVVVSDELLCITSVELSSPDVGVIQAQERQYMSLLQHPETIPVQ